MFAGDELLFEFNGIEELGIIEFWGFEITLRILVLPFVTGIAAVANSTYVLKSEFSLWLFFLYLYALSVGVSCQANFLHHFG